MVKNNYAIPKIVTFSFPVGSEVFYFCRDSHGSLSMRWRWSIPERYLLTYERTGVAQFGSVHGWGPCGRRFKSCHPDKQKA